MNYENYKSMNVLFGLDLNIPVYKYIPLKYVMAMIQNCTLRIDPVSRWEDPYENWFLKEEFQLVDDGTRFDAKSQIPGAFGQCWSKIEESDAMWRIYSDVKKKTEDPTSGLEYLQNSAVRIKTTARKIFDAAYLDGRDLVSVFIGCVNYLSQEDFNNLVKNLSPLSSQNLNEPFKNSYFYKRDTFAHEEEIRLIILAASNGDDRFKKEFLSFSIDPASFIEELVADPRLSEEEYQYVSGQLSSVGFPQQYISQSNLYKFVPSTIQVC